MKKIFASTFVLIIYFATVGVHALAMHRKIGSGVISTSSSIPPPALTAGFTTLALLSDFTTPMPVNWIGGCAIAGNGSAVNSSDTTGHTWWLNPWWSNTYQNCNTVQVTDPTFGGLVLDVPWITDSNAWNVGTELQSAAWFSTLGANTGVNFPNNAYYEMTFRITPISKGSWGGIFTWPVLAMTDSAQGGLENDVIELDTGQLNFSDAAVHNWAPAACGANCPGQFIWEGYGALNGGLGIPGLPLNFDPNIYHKFGLLTTSDGSSYKTCAYVDDVFNGCISPPGGFPIGFEATERLMLMMINACDYWNNTCNPNGTLQHMYVKNVQAYSCPTWQTTQCNGPVYSGPPPGPNQLGNIWTNSGATQAPATAPGGAPAIQIIESTSTGNKGVIQTGPFTNAISTFSVDVAPGTVGNGPVSIAGLSSVDYAGANFDPTTGAFNYTFQGGAGAVISYGSSIISGTCPSFPNCGVKLWLTFSLSSVTGVAIIVGDQNAGDGVTNILAWNWALTTGTTPP